MALLTERAFAGHRQKDWDSLDGLVRKAQARGLAGLSTEEVVRLPALYRDVCMDLARAQGARYSAPLVDYLQGLTASAHSVVYGASSGREAGGGSGAGPATRGRARGRAFIASLPVAFPRAVWRHRGAILLGALLFFVPLAAGASLALRDPAYAFRIVPEASLKPLTEAYAKGFAEGRDLGEDALMAGFYVNNNVGIALRCFAMGIFGGLGSAFYLVENGLSIGAILGYVASHSPSARENILTFIVGHGSFELGAICLAGGAGMAMGWSVVRPGPLRRLAALQAVARDVFIIVLGAALMLLVAAGIEGFWSGSSIPSEVKRGVGAGMFVVLVLYLVVLGPSRSADEGTASPRGGR